MPQRRSRGVPAIVDAPAPVARRPLVGRVEQQRQLARMWDRTRAGAATLALISGDPGAGKSSLAARATDLASPDGIVLSGGCVDIVGTDVAYLPIVDALRSLPSTPETDEIWAAAQSRWPVLSDLARDLIRGASDATVSVDRQPTARDQEIGRHQLFAAVHGFLTLLADRRPVLLVVEDLHWSDGSSRNLLAYLARTLRGARVAVLVTYRSADARSQPALRTMLAELARLPGAERIVLPPLDRDEMAAFLDTLAGRPVPIDTVTHIHRRSDGNPFFAELLLRAHESGIAELPEEVADLVLTALSALSPAARAMVVLTSIAHRPVPESILTAVSTLTPESAEEGLAEAVSAGLLVVQGSGYVPRHALFAEAVEASLLPGERVRWHVRYTQVLRSGGNPDQAELAHHLQAGNDLAGARSAAIAAAERATALRAPAEALRLWSLALDLGDRLGVGDRLDVLRRAQVCAMASGRFERLQELAEAAVVEADDRGGLPDRVAARSALAAHLVEYGPGRSNRERGVSIAVLALDLLDQAERVGSVPGATALRARLFLSRAVGVMWEHPVSAAALYRTARELALQAGEVVLAAEAGLDLSLLMGRHRIAGDRDELVEAIVAELQPWLDRTEARMVALLADQIRMWSLIEAAHLTEAIALADQALARAAQWGQSEYDWAGLIAARRTDLLFQTGRWDEVLTVASAAPDAGSTTGRECAWFAAAVLGERDPAAALRWSERVRGINWFADLRLDLVESRRERLAGRLERAVVVARRGWDAMWEHEEWLELVPGAIETAAAVADLAGDARQSGDGTLARSLAEEAAGVADRARAVDLGYPPVGTLFGDALWGRLDAEVARAAGTDTAQTWIDVAGLADRAGRIPDRLDATFRAAVLLLDAGDRGERTRDLLAAAQRDVDLLGATVLGRQLDDLRRRARLGPADRPGTRTVPLSDRERQVLALVARGRSNVAIARELFISDKTVSVHVSHILAKIGASSRTEAAALARLRGWLDPVP